MIDNIHTVEVFRMIDIDLPDNYLNNAQFSQIQRLTKIRNELQKPVPDMSETQSLLKKFIMDLDFKEAYDFASLNPFLINEEELHNLIQEIAQEENDVAQEKMRVPALDLEKMV